MSDQQELPELIETLEDGVLCLTLNRPDSLNALNPSLMRSLGEAMERAAHNADVGCVILTGAGRAFCAGGDMKASAAARSATAPRPPSTLESRVAWLRRSMEAARLLHDMAKPTIAMVNGACAGAGLSLAGACDLRLAAEEAVFTTAFAKAGLAGDYGGSWFWTRILGTAKARELYLLCEKMDARRALSFGLVSEVVAADQLRSRTFELARRLADGPRSAYAYMKRNLNAAEAGQLGGVFDVEAQNMMLSRQALSAKG